MARINPRLAQAIIIGALALAPVTGAAAADLDYSEPLAMPIEACCTSGWYIKGFLGMTSYEADDIEGTYYPGTSHEVLNQAFEGSGFGGLGLGYEWSSWLRFDVTSEYRNRSTFHGLEGYQNYYKAGTTEYTATVKSWVTLANAYWDIGTWGGVTPYVGGGIGYAKNWVGDYLQVSNRDVLYGNTTDDGGLAWSLQAGLAYDVTPNFTIDLAYRYLNLGDADAGKAYSYKKDCVEDAIEFDNLHSNDIMLAARWKFGGAGPAPMPVALK